MRLTELHISLPADQVPAHDSEERAAKRWWDETKPLRTKGWQWTDLPAEVVRQGIQAIMDDHGQNTRGLGLMVSGLLYDRPEGERQWSWTLPVRNGKTVTFEAKAFIADPNEVTPAVRMALAADTKADQARLALLGALNKTTTISADVMEHVLDEVVSPVSRPKEHLTLDDIPAEALQAEMVRIDQVWPKEISVIQFFLLAAPLAMWLRGLDDQASTTELTLKGLTSTTQPRPAHAACKLVVTYA